MKQTRLLMGMPITVEVIDPAVSAADFDAVFAYFGWVDDTFSPYKQCSAITRLNMGLLTADQAEPDVQTILRLAEQTKQETDGYFDIYRDGGCDPSGIVKGWAIYQAANLLRRRGFERLYIEAGGDIQTYGANADGSQWRVGIRNPFQPSAIVRVIYAGDAGIATSGTYIRGDHIYNPKSATPLQTDIVSLTVIGPDVYEADRFATAAFAMGREGITFIASLPGFEGYQIDQTGRATFTRGFERATHAVS